MASAQVLSHPMCKDANFIAHAPVMPADAYYFAFARVKGELCLVQVSCATPTSALTAVDVKLFRHEFITIFRFAENRTLHPADINIVELIDENLTRYEEENETVFLARDLMERMRNLTDPRRNMGMGSQNARTARHSQMRMQKRQR